MINVHHEAVLAGPLTYLTCAYFVEGNESKGLGEHGSGEVVFRTC